MIDCQFIEEKKVQQACLILHTVIRESRQLLFFRVVVLNHFCIAVGLDGSRQKHIYGALLSSRHFLLRQLRTLSPFIKTYDFVSSLTTYNNSSLEPLTN